MDTTENLEAVQGYEVQERRLACRHLVESFSDSGGDLVIQGPFPWV